MDSLVIGAGLSGVSCAYALAKRGHGVTVLDRREGPGLEASFANGALVTPSMSEPWNAPGCWKVLLKSIGKSDSPLQLHLSSILGMIGWGARFLRNSNATLYREHTLSNLRLALYSLQCLKDLRTETGVASGGEAQGTLRVFRDAESLSRAADRAAQMAAHGLLYRMLTREATVELEPALLPISARLAGSIQYPMDEVGDAHQFCVRLAERARQRGVQFHFQTSVEDVEVRSGRLAAIIAGGERWVGDQYLVAAGSGSTEVLRRCGLTLPVQPVKGYSVSFPAGLHGTALHLPVIDDDRHAVVVPLDGAVRVAGTAEFIGYHLTVPRARIDNLVRLVKQILPQGVWDTRSARAWCGLRAMSADGVPILGPTPIQNLYVNTAHGHLGWTLAAGCARVLADQMSDARPALDPTPYTLSRFGR